MLQSGKFVSARPCISSGVSCLVLDRLEVDSSFRAARRIVRFATLLGPPCLRDRAPQRGIKWDYVRFWAVRLLCINSFKHSCSPSLVVTGHSNITWVCRASQVNSGRVKCVKVLRRGLRQATGLVVRSSWFMLQCLDVWLSVTLSSKVLWVLFNVCELSISGSLINILLWIFNT